MSERIRYALAEPGSPAARLGGCTCPQQERQDRPDGGATYERDPYCPVHTENHAFMQHRARASADGALSRARTAEARHGERRA